jgi:superfamily II DNA or RNA helicase
MKSYPLPNDPDFYSFINKKFKKYEIKKIKGSMKDYCLPKKFKLQVQQKFLSDYINPLTPYKSLLMYHKIGAGKTCTAISIAEKWKNKRRIIIILPAALIGNFKDELRSSCGNYLNDTEKKRLVKLDPSSKDYELLIKQSDKKISKYYEIYSYHKFVDLANNKKINLDNSLLIIDEVQNMISMSGTFYKTLYNTIIKSPEDLRLILLSATPMFDKPVELALTMNLLRPKEMLPIGGDFNDMFLRLKKTKEGYKYQVQNLIVLKEMLKGLVSYYRGAPPYTFPEEEFKLVKCKMSNFQYKSYKTTLAEDGNNKGIFKDADILNMPKNFFLGARMVSNVSFPNKGINHTGYMSFRGDNLKFMNLEEFSIKFVKIMKKINKSEGPVFVYSNFKEYGGIKPFVKVLEKHKWKNYKEHGIGEKRFAIWSGDEPHSMKDKIKRVFNKKENSDGSNIKIMIGSPSIKEGVTLLRVEQVHIMEPYWNMSRMLQIIGRAVRFCSHKDLPKRKRNVKTYLYLATHPNEEKTVDQYIWKLAQKKSKLINVFEKALKEVAIDCSIFKNANVFNDEEDYVCYV